MSSDLATKRSTTLIGLEPRAMPWAKIKRPFGPQDNNTAFASTMPLCRLLHRWAAGPGARLGWSLKPPRGLDDVATSYLSDQAGIVQGKVNGIANGLKTHQRT